MTRTRRLLAIMQVLRERRTPVTAADLAQRFEVSERTLYRDIATLIELGAAIEGAPGMGYAPRPDFFLPPLMLEALELDALALGARFVMRRGDLALQAAAQSAIGKIEAVLPQGLNGAAGINGLVVGPAGPDGRERLSEVREALQAECKLRIRYRTGDRPARDRVIWPIALGFFEASEILAAWCEDRGAYRAFRRPHRAAGAAARTPSQAAPHPVLRVAAARTRDPAVTAPDGFCQARRLGCGAHAWRRGCSKARSRSSPERRRASAKA